MYRRKQKPKNILDLELGSCEGSQGHQPACTRFWSQETVFGKIWSSSLPAFGTQSDWLLLSSSHHFRKKLSFSTATAKSLHSCPALCDPIEVRPQALPPLGSSNQEHWSGLPFPSPMHESEK